MKKKGEGGGGMPVVTLIGIIVLVVLLFIVLGSLAKGDYPNWVKNALPWLTVDNSTVQRTPDCPNIVAEIGKTEGSILEGAVGQREQYLYINGQKTNLYWRAVSDSSNKKLKGKVWLNIPGGGNDIEVGGVYRNDLFNRDELLISEDFVRENEYAFLKNKDYLPDIYYMKILHSSFKYRDKNYFCKNDEDIKIFDDLKKCVESCSLFEGMCKQSSGCSGGEVSYGRINCKEGQECCVKETREKLKAENFDLRSFVFWGPEISSEKKNLKEGENSFQVEVGGRYQVYFGVNYSEADTNFLQNLCIIMKTNKENLLKEFLGTERYKLSVVDYEQNLRGATVNWLPTDEKSFELLLLNVKTNQEVYKRVKIMPKTKEGAAPDKNYVADKDFYESAKSLEVGKGFYVFLGRGWTFKKGQVFATKFWVEKVGDSKFKICVYVDRNRFIKEEWYYLDCYIGFLTIGKNIELKDLGWSLSETLPQCSWDGKKCD